MRARGEEAACLAEPGAGASGGGQQISQRVRRLNHNVVVALRARRARVKHRQPRWVPQGVGGRCPDAALRSKTMIAMQVSINGNLQMAHSAFQQQPSWWKPAASHAALNAPDDCPCHLSPTYLSWHLFKDNL